MVDAVVAVDKSSVLALGEADVAVVSGVHVDNAFAFAAVGAAVVAVLEYGQIFQSDRSVKVFHSVSIHLDHFPDVSHILSAVAQSLQSVKVFHSVSKHSDHFPDESHILPAIALDPNAGGHCNQQLMINDRYLTD